MTKTIETTKAANQQAAATPTKTHAITPNTATTKLAATKKPAKPIATGNTIKTTRKASQPPKNTRGKTALTTITPPIMTKKVTINALSADNAGSAKPVAVSIVDASKPKTEKIKMERDSFTMPKDEYAQIPALKKRLEGLGRAVKKSELLRAGLKILAQAEDTQLLAALAAIPVIKTGRPHKKH